MLIKLYTSEVPVVVDNLKNRPAPSLPPLVGMVMDNLGTTMEQTQKNLEQAREALASVNVGFVPSPVTMPCRNGPSDWFSKDWWKKYCESYWPVLQVRQTDPLHYDSFAVHFDFENFYTNHIEAIPSVCDFLGGKAKLEEAMQPWLEMTKSEGVVPLLTPPSPPPNRNYMMELMIERALDGKVVLQDQGTYGCDIKFRTNALADFADHLLKLRERRLQLITWAKACGGKEVVYQAGMTEQTLRKWSKRFVLDVLPTLCGMHWNDYWMYCDDKQSQRDKGRGGLATFLSQDWYEGVVPATAGFPGNPINKGCRWWPLGQASRYGEWNTYEKFVEMNIQPNGTEMIGHDPPRQVDAFAANAWQEGDNQAFPSRRYLQIDGLGHTSESFTLAFDVLPLGDLLIFDSALCGVWNNRPGAVNPAGLVDHKEWQLRLLNSNVVLDVVDRSKVRTATVGTLKEGWNRIAIQWNLATESWKIGNYVMKVENAWLSSQPFRLGIGSKSDGLNWNRIHSPGLLFRNVQYWPWTPELAAVSDVSKCYPY